jgi:MoaA/NifB/PqqE/SkfB family radical SAM enzyme
MKTTSYILSDALKVRENRNEAYKCAFKYLQKNYIPGIINQKELKLYWNINLYIDITAQCNCYCSFCINCVDFDRGEINDELYLEKLENAIQQIKHLEPSIQIIGGEPTLKKLKSRLSGILNLIKKYNLRKAVIGSNGSGFTDIEFAEKINPYFSHINISRHHYDQIKLNQVWRFNNPLTNNHLQELVKSKISDKIRLNCCLLKGYIDNFEEINYFVEWAMDLGVKNICFATLSELPDNYIYPDSYIKKVDGFQIDFESIMNCVSNHKDYSFLKFHSGTHCMYEVWKKTYKNKECTIVFATSNNNFAKKLDLKSDLIELLVFHTDGTLTGSWNKNVKQLII